MGPLVLKYRVVKYFWLLNCVSRTLYLLGHTLLTFSQSALRYYGCDRLSGSGRQNDLYRISYKMLLIVFLYGDVKFISVELLIRRFLIVSPYWDVRFIYHNSSRLANNCSSYVDGRDY